MACPVCGLEVCNDILEAAVAAGLHAEEAGKGTPMISNVDLYMTEDRSAVVGADDPKARFLLINAGREVHANELDLFAPGASGMVQAFLDEQSGESADEEDEVTTKRRGRGRQTSPADAGAEDASRKGAPEAPKQPEGENLDDANLAELQAVATERGVSFEDDDDEDTLRLRLAEASK